MITATAVNATVLQTITAAATAASSSFYVKRSVGSGSIFITRDGGTTWVDITSLINSSTFTRVKIENTSVTNPVVGFKIATNGDAVIVDYGQNEAGQQVSMPILTTTAAATRNADVLNYPTAGNFSDTAGTILATVRRDDWSASNGSVVGSSTTGLHTRGSTNGAQALDGTNTVLGPTGAVEGKRTMGIRYSGSSMKVYSGGSSGSPGSYDGSFNLSNIGIITGTHGYIRDVAIWQTELSDADLDSVATPRTTPGVTAESITAADTLGSAVKVSTSRAESSAVAEAMATAISTGASVAESSAVAEASSPEVSVSAGRSESLTVAEAASPEVSVSIGRSESLIVVDNPSVSVQPLNVESTNTGVIADNISQALGAIMQHQISATYSITTITASYSIISFEAKI